MSEQSQVSLAFKTVRKPRSDGPFIKLAVFNCAATAPGKIRTHSLSGLSTGARLSLWSMTTGSEFVESMRCLKIFIFQYDRLE